MADIQLSPQLFKDIHDAVSRQEPEADDGVVLQYLAAVMGYMVGSQRGMDAADSAAFLKDLCGFARHVYDDLAQRQQQQTAPASGEAFGIWEPPAK